MRYGRKAYGAHRQMSVATQVRNIAASVQKHQAEGQHRTAGDYGLTVESALWQMVLERLRATLAA